MEQFKGYIITNDKRPIETFKNKTSEELHSLEVVEKLPEFAGVIESGYLLVDVDNQRDSNILLEIVKDFKLDTKVYQTTRGMHFYFRTTDRTVTNKTDAFLGVGIRADMKLGNRNSYAVIKDNGVKRKLLYETGRIGRIPVWLTQVRYTFDFLNMEEGDGRNQALFNYILTLQTHEYSKEQARECIRIIGKYVLEDKMDDSELDTILRDDAFNKPNFFGGKNNSKFMFDKFAKYMVSEHNIIKIQGHLHTYEDGVYVNDEYGIEHQMIQYIPTLRQSQRTEVLRYINILVRDDTPVSPAHYIAFENGVYDLSEDKFLDFSEDIIITNKIPWNYNPKAYSYIADNTLDKIACFNANIRAIMDEVIGYTFYRRNELGKAFMLTGAKSNGKSTYLEMIQNLLGYGNTSSLSLHELSERFRTAELFGKLANIGDDIGDEFISDTSTFKKLTTGERLTVERKGDDPFQLSNYSKLLFSANNIPRMSDSTGAVLRRLVIIPFDAKFSVDDPDYDPYIKYKLESPEVMEYLINIGLEGLKRVIRNNKFTTSQQIDEHLHDYNLQNNPIQVFFDEIDFENEVLHQSTQSVYNQYVGFCNVNYLRPMSRLKFTTAVNDYFDLESTRLYIDGRREYTFMRKNEHDMIEE